MSLFGKIFLKGFLRWLIISCLIFSIIFLFKVIYDPASLTASGQQFVFEGLRLALYFALLCGIADCVIYQIKSLKRNESRLEKD